MQKQASNLSVIMPVFNEEQTISSTVTDCIEKVAQYFDQFEIIIVDDASEDNSAGVILALARKVSQLVILRNNHNLGHGPSIQRAMSVVTGDLVFIIDSDYQHDPKDFWKLFALYDEKSIVTGYRSTRADEWYRRAFSWAGNYVIRVLCGTSARDINIPFKLVPASRLETLLKTQQKSALVPSALLMIGASHYQFPVYQVPIQHLPRRFGKSSLPGFRFIVFAIKAMLEIFGYRASLRKNYYCPRSTTL